MFPSPRPHRAGRGQNTRNFPPSPPAPRCREHLTAGANARQHHCKLTAYADPRDRLLGLDAEVPVDTGAYSVWPFTAVLEAVQTGGNLPGLYDFRALYASWKPFLDSSNNWFRVSEFSLDAFRYGNPIPGR
jgi:hypothetical protein